ncbi:TOP3A isoform 18, partial [Pongo abelii]
FVAHGLMILARNYLDVYPYDHWSDKILPVYEQGSRFQPSTVEMVDGETSPPKLLTEADLIALMEKHGIGQWLLWVRMPLMRSTSRPSKPGCTWASPQTSGSSLGTWAWDLWKVMIPWAMKCLSLTSGLNWKLI